MSQEIPLFVCQGAGATVHLWKSEDKCGSWFYPSAVSPQD